MNLKSDRPCDVYFFFECLTDSMMQTVSFLHKYASIELVFTANYVVNELEHARYYV